MFGKRGLAHQVTTSISHSRRNGSIGPPGAVTARSSCSARERSSSAAKRADPLPVIQMRRSAARCEVSSSDAGEEEERGSRGPPVDPVAGSAIGGDSVPPPPRFGVRSHSRRCHEDRRCARSASGGNERKTETSRRLKSPLCHSPKSSKVLAGKVIGPLGEVKGYEIPRYASAVEECSFGAKIQKAESAKPEGNSRHGSSCSPRPRPTAAVDSPRKKLRSEPSAAASSATPDSPRGSG